MKYDNDRLGAALKMYLGTEPLPMHMPGHKRNPDVISNIFSRDITEISTFRKRPEQEEQADRPKRCTPLLGFLRTWRTRRQLSGTRNTLTAL